MADARRPAADSIRRLLDRIVKQHPDVKDVADEIDRLLDQLQEGAQSRTPPVQRRTGEGVVYRIELVNRRPMLSERRPAGAPLRVGKELFDALVAVLSESSKPITYEEIVEQAQLSIEARIAEWQGRMVLRFLQRADPPLLIRERSRYRVRDRQHFTSLAQKLWRSASKN